MYFFNNLRSMPILIALGFYKLLPNKDFLFEILIGYAIESTTSVIAMLSLQFNNNSAIDGSLTWLQTTSLSLRLISCLMFVFEVLIVGWECLITYRMRDSNIKRYKRLSDLQRCELYGPRHAKVSLITVITFLIMLILGVALIPERECPLAAKGET